MIGRNRGVSILPPFIDSEQNDWYRGSADAVYKNIDFVRYHDPEEIIILSGDHIYKMDYRNVLEYHREKDADLTVVCKKIDRKRASRFGMAVIDDEDGEQGGRVVSYQEKIADPEGEWSSLTVLCFKPEVLYEVLEENQKHDASFEFGYDIIPRLLATNRKIYGYKFDGYWGYTRTVQEYWQANMDLLGENPLVDIEQWGVRTNLDHRNIRGYQPTYVGEKSVIENSLVYNGCQIEGEVKNSIIFPGVKIAEGSSVCDSVIFFNNVIEKNCSIQKTISDVNCNYNEGVRVGMATYEGQKKIAIVGWNNTVPSFTELGEGVTISPRLSQEKWLEFVAPGEVVR